MMKLLLMGVALCLAGCGSIPPTDLDVELELFGGLIKVNPAITIGDGKVGPTDVEVIIDEERLQ
jgi:hypothetical protein